MAIQSVDNEEQGIIQKVIHADSTTELVELRDYPCEDHFVVSQDGYFLYLHRIPNQHYGPTAWTAPLPYNKPTILLWHGLCQSSEVFVCHPVATQNMAFALADVGFDVWMMNVRGNKYSRKHERYKLNSTEFWQFSMDEIAQYDVPDVIHYIRKTTGRNFLDIITVGQGCFPIFAALSINAELNVYVKRVIGYQPSIISSTDMPKYLGPENLFDLFGKTSIGTGLSYVTRYFPRFSSPVMKVLLKHVYGCTMSKVGNPQTALALQSHTLSSTSVSFLVHSLQQTTDGLKQFGKPLATTQNSLLTGFLWRPTTASSGTPHLYYPTKQITTNIIIFSKSNIQEQLSELLPVKLTMMTRDDMEQMDYLWSTEANFIWKKVMDILRKH